MSEPINDLRNPDGFFFNGNPAKGFVPEPVSSLPTAGAGTTYPGQLYTLTSDGYVYQVNQANDGFDKVAKSGDVPANVVTRSANAGAVGEMLVSAGTDKTAKTYAGSDGILKSASGVVSAATAGTDYVTGASTNTLTNKTFDANGTGNSISNIELADLASSAKVANLNTRPSDANTLVNAQAIYDKIVSEIQGLGQLAGDHDASGGIPASTSGTGASGAIQAGDMWYVTTAGTITGLLGEATLSVGDLIVAKVDGADAANEFIGLDTNVGTASTSAKGKVELATQAETEARSDNGRAVTPDALQDFDVTKSFTFDGDGSTTAFTVAHNLGIEASGFKARVCKKSDGTPIGVKFEAAASDTSNNIKVTASPALATATYTVQLTY